MSPAPLTRITRVGDRRAGLVFRAVPLGQTPLILVSVAQSWLPKWHMTSLFGGKATRFHNPRHYPGPGYQCKHSALPCQSMQEMQDWFLDSVWIRVGYRMICSLSVVLSETVWVCLTTAGKTLDILNLGKCLTRVTLFVPIQSPCYCGRGGGQTTVPRASINCGRCSSLRLDHPSLLHRSNRL